MNLPFPENCFENLANKVKDSNIRFRNKEIVYIEDANLYKSCGKSEHKIVSTYRGEPHKYLSIYTCDDEYLGFAYMQQGEFIAAEREFSQAVEMAMGGMAFEHKRLEAAKARLASGLNPQDRKGTENEISTAAKAGRIAANRYSRAMSYLQRVREELSKLAQP